MNFKNAKMWNYCYGRLKILNYQLSIIVERCTYCAVLLWMLFVVYQSSTVCVEHSQAAEHCLVLLHVFFEGKTSHQSRHDLLQNTKLNLTELPTIFCIWWSSLTKLHLLQRDSLHIAHYHPAERSTQVVNHPEVRLFGQQVGKHRQHHGKVSGTCFTKE